MALYVAGSVLLYFAGYRNLGVPLFLSAVRGIGCSGASALSFMFVPDCIEYSQFSNGRRNEGVSFALQTFVNKLNTAIISSVSAFFLAMLGFSAANVTPQGQQGVWIAYTILSAIGGLAAIPLLKGYRLRDRQVAVMMKANNNEITREEAMVLLGEQEP